MLRGWSISFHALSARTTYGARFVDVVIVQIRQLRCRFTFFATSFKPAPSGFPGLGRTFLPLVEIREQMIQRRIFRVGCDLVLFVVEIV